MTGDPPTIRFLLPSLLEPVVGKDHLVVSAHTVAGVLEAAFQSVPVLRHHLCSQAGDLRPHILCLHNGVNVARSKLASTRLADGDEILIHQAISGG